MLPSTSTAARQGIGASTLLLFAVATVIWGTTWLVIKFQLGVVAPEVSVAWRFALASVLLLGWCVVRGLPLRFRPADHLSLAALGAVLFGVNYILVYWAETYLTSGLVAVLFSFIVFWNLLGDRLLFGTPIPGAVTVGAVLGVAGVALLFWPEVRSVRTDTRILAGAGFAVLGSLTASTGSLMSQRIFARRIPVVPGTAFGMGYAATMIVVWCVVRGVPLGFDARAPYLLSLAYLSVLGSVTAFVTYLTLVQRIGSGRAGYTAAVIPVVAMLASTVFEGYRWTASAVAGMALVLAGTFLVLRAKARR